MIPFNKPYLSGKETEYIRLAVASGKISGDGIYTQKCHEFLQEKFGFRKVLLTTSCTDALEMAALLVDIQPGDEVIVPSFTFVSTVNAFALRGAKIVFVDSENQSPNMDVKQVEALITEKTKAIVPVHYAGVSCDMDALMEIASRHGLFVVEDAAQAIDSYYKGRPLGSIGHLAAFSFHETKNIISGEGGMLVINDERFLKRAEIIREKGTNRSAYFRGEVDKYAWVDLGSSFLPSDIIAAFLYAQLENLEDIQARRRFIWQRYDQAFKAAGLQERWRTPHILSYATNNAHMYYIVTKSLEERDRVITYCKKQEFYPVFHYVSLHKSPYFTGKYQGEELPCVDFYSDNLLRLPFYYELKTEEQEHIIRTVIKAARS